MLIVIDILNHNIETDFDDDKIKEEQKAKILKDEKLKKEIQYEISKRAPQLQIVEIQ